MAVWQSYLMRNCNNNNKRPIFKSTKYKKKTLHDLLEENRVGKFNYQGSKHIFTNIPDDVPDLGRNVSVD